MRILPFGLSLLLGAITGFAAAPAGYLFATFDGGTEQVHFGLSRDGRQWTALNDGKPCLINNLGTQGARAPYLFRANDNRGFYIIATDLGVNRMGGDWGKAVREGSRSLVIWESKNLVNWSEPRLVKVAPDDAGCTWAPEVIFDPETSDYLIYWASTTGRDQFAKHRIWACRTKDFKTFGEPFIYIDNPATTIDTTIVREGEFYYRFTKDEKESSITMERATRIAGPWTAVSGFNLGHLKGYEGPTCFIIQPASAGRPATWCLMLDHFAKGLGYEAFITRDLSKGVFEPAGDVKFPFKFRHGTVLPLTDQEYRRIESSPTPPATVSAPPPTPILDGFTADPSIRVFGDTYYVYPTSDKPNWLTTDFSVWSSKDLVRWKKERMILDVANDLKWANIRAWAPDCIERNGTYYFYFCADHKIGVATAKSPAGPFKDVLGKPLLDIKADKRITSNTIDPYPFIDDDGQAYLYWGNSNGPANVFKLNKDMISLDGPPVEFVIRGRSSGEVIDFREGIVVFKRQGRYYFMWSVDDARSDDYRVAYGTSDSPFGPVEVPENATVLRKNGPAKGTGHHSVVNVPGTDRWYVAYHRHAIPGGGGYQRETCLARMEFAPDGSILPMDPMQSPFAPGDRGEPVKAKR